MHVNTISKNNQPNFGAIYVQKNKYTTSQKNIINQIHNTLNKPLEKFNNQSANEFYKAKNGIDFYMENGNSEGESIYLAGYKGVRQIGTGVNEAITYRGSFSIGTYDEEHTFKVDDIEYGIKEANEQASGFLATAGLVTITFFTLILGAILGLHDKEISKDAAKPLIENIDSTANKVGTIKQDTVDLIKNTIK